MSSAPVTIKISPAIAEFVRPGTDIGKKMQAFELLSSLEPVDTVTLLFCLANDKDSGVKQKGRNFFQSLPDETLNSYLFSLSPHPSITALIERILEARGCSMPKAPPAEYAQESMEELESEIADDYIEDDENQQFPDEEGEINEESEEFLSKYRLALIMGTGEKIKMALTGDKEWRALLIKDSNKLVSGSVIKNPRITDGEILTILKAGIQNDDILRLICANKEWIKNYKIRKALVDCPRTPLPNALRYLASLDLKDIAGYAKSKSVSTVIATQAKRMILAKKR